MSLYGKNTSSDAASISLVNRNTTTSLFPTERWQYLPMLIALFGIYSLINSLISGIEFIKIIEKFDPVYFIDSVFAAFQILLFIHMTYGKSKLSIGTGIILSAISLLGWVLATSEMTTYKYSENDLFLNRISFFNYVPSLRIIPHQLFNLIWSKDSTLGDRLLFILNDALIIGSCFFIYKFKYPKSDSE